MCSRECGTQCGRVPPVSVVTAGVFSYLCGCAQVNAALAAESFALCFAGEAWVGSCKVRSRSEGALTRCRILVQWGLVSGCHAQGLRSFSMGGVSQTSPSHLSQVCATSQSDQWLMAVSIIKGKNGGLRGSTSMHLRDVVFIGHEDRGAGGQDSGRDQRDMAQGESPAHRCSSSFLCLHATFQHVEHMCSTTVTWPRRELQA